MRSDPSRRLSVGSSSPSGPPAGCRGWAVAAATVLVIAVAAACGSAGPEQGGTGGSTAETQWVVRQAEQSPLAIVFVHGIFGDALATWTDDSGRRLFDLLNETDAAAGRADMLAFGFPSSMFDAGSFDVREAANRLHMRLEYHGVLTYRRIVFVAHSMGGLVVMRELLTHPAVRAKVPVVVFFATPQEGADITRIARHVSPNLALLDMRPADANTLLKTLSDEWSAIPPDGRPRVRCAYEKLPTVGVMIVPWSSATRFCEGATPAIAADHIGIVKAGDVNADAVAVIVNALNEYVLNATLEPKLETPDFRREGDRDVVELPSRLGRHSARLVNAGGSSLRFTIAEVSPPSLFVWPADTPRELPARQVDLMHLAIGFGSEETEFSFLLRTDAGDERSVLVRAPDLAAARQEEAELLESIALQLMAAVDDQTLGPRLRAASPDDAAVLELVTERVKDVVATHSPDLPSSAQWVLAADALNALNWPALSRYALRNAERESPGVAAMPAVERLAAKTAALSGSSEIFDGRTTPIARFDQDPAEAMASADVTRRWSATAMNLATRLQDVPALKVFGLSLQGDVLAAAGDRTAARRAFAEAEQVRPTPSLSSRLSAVRRGGGGG